MRADQFEARLGDLVSGTVGGGTPARSVAAYWGGEMPWASVKDLSDTLTDLDSTQESITPAGVSHSTSNVVEPGTVLVATRMAVGRSAVAQRRVAINQDLKGLIPDQKKTTSRFLLHQLKRIQPRLEQNAIGSTVLGLSTSALLDACFFTPPLPQQRRIAEILDTLDEAIRKTEQLIAKLKQVKQGLLHDLLTRGLDENGELRDPERHPEQFKKSPLGRIPMEWGLWKLSDVGSWVSGGTPSKANPAYWGGPLPWVSPKDMKKLLLARTQDTVTEEGAAAGSRIVPANSIFIVVRGMILAHTFPVCIAMTQMAFNQDVKAIIPAEDIEGRYLAYWFVANSERMLQIVTEATHGTKRIDLNDLHRQYMAVPALGEQKRILRILESTDARLMREQAEADKYRLLKQGLMEDLLTGRVRVTPLLSGSTP